MSFQTLKDRGTDQRLEFKKYTTSSNIMIESALDNYDAKKQKVSIKTGLPSR